MSESALKGSDSKFYPHTNITLEKSLMSTKEMNDNSYFSGVFSTKTID